MSTDRLDRYVRSAAFPMTVVGTAQADVIASGASSGVTDLSVSPDGPLFASSCLFSYDDILVIARAAQFYDYLGSAIVLGSQYLGTDMGSPVYTTAAFSRGAAIWNSTLGTLTTGALVEGTGIDRTWIIDLGGDLTLTFDFNYDLPPSGPRPTTRARSNSLHPEQLVVHRGGRRPRRCPGSVGSPCSRAVPRAFVASDSEWPDRHLEPTPTTHRPAGSGGVLQLPRFSSEGRGRVEAGVVDPAPRPPMRSVSSAHHQRTTSPRLIMTALRPAAGRMLETPTPSCARGTARSRSASRRSR